MSQVRPVSCNCVGQGDTGLPQYGSVILVLLHSWLFTCPLLLCPVNMLALITEKLQSQSLDDSAASSAGPARIKLPFSREDTIKISATSQASLAVKGKNVWALSIDSSSGERKCDPPGKHGKNCDKLTVALCRHKKPVHKCSICDNTPGTPTAPPKKKHCRSLSVPADSSTGSSWQPVGSKLWKPIAVIPLTNNNVHQKNRNLIGRFTNDFKSGTACTNTSNIVRCGASPLSVDSGHFTTSDLQTPPGSPIPRPASALSDVSYGSWMEHSPNRINRFEILQNRSLSCEDRISGCSPSGSTPSVAGFFSSTPSSPYRHKIPRCRSQPCVLHDRKCGKKRRRDYNRPALNFQKMTETAYSRIPRSEPLCTPGQDYQKRTSRFREELESAMRLMPIASSPLDTDIPIKRVMDSFHASPIGELRHAASIELPLTPPQTGMCTEIDIKEPVRLMGDEDETSGCDCRDDDGLDDGTDMFPLTDLDIEQIENH